MTGLHGERTGGPTVGDEHRLLTLHALRLKGRATALQLADVFGVDPDRISRELATAGQQDLVTSRSDSEGTVRWSLTAEGRTVGEKLLAQELAQRSVARGRSAVASITEIYHRFLPLNQSLLTVCTDWQVRSQAPLQLNDHTDAAYDLWVIERLREIDGQVDPICVELEELLQRFNRYGSGFKYALARIDNGETEWFAKPTLQSYHTLWFELHEDLLATLGLDRAAENNS